ncbi:MAG TPA: SIS domain-containing protein [Desulfomonilaceae bacterium]|nr:SIS domain-containing protein [Desulfomonilaceae bacterium]
MCGIAGFIGNNRWKETSDPAWLDTLLSGFETAAVSDNWENLSLPLKSLVARFDDIMSFGLHMELVKRSEVWAKMERLADTLTHISGKLNDFIAERGRSDFLELLAENTTDCTWQIREEVLGNVTRTTSLLPNFGPSSGFGRSEHYVAWAIEQALENIDRLEVRGRDSAGISIQCLASRSEGIGFLPEPPEGLGVNETVRRRIHQIECHDGSHVFIFIYKIANLVGRLGDNTGGLREAIRSDEDLWKVAGITDQINILAHTRWASNGIISLSNSHPADGSLYGKEHLSSLDDREAQFVLNGDVDNYHQMVEQFVQAQGYNIDPTVTTDAKILPVFYRLGTDPALPAEDRFAELMNKCEGSLAVVMQHPHHPRALYLGQKGSGQSLFVGKVSDGAILASEVYGLAARTRYSYSLSGTERGGTQVRVDVANPAGEIMVGRFLKDLGPFEVKAEPIYIHSRDIFRGSYDYYFEKEIHESPLSVLKTIRGKYRKIGQTIDFSVGGDGAFNGLLKRLRDPNQPPIRRIMCIGQGTASVAAMGAAYLIERALARSRIKVDWRKASEMSGFLSDEPLEDMLLIAISQSGTTTDTNRTVDVAGSQGAWIHAIVNRRNSPLVDKSNSYFYTSDGRDVEMAVASTKAFYSQVAAAKLTALLLAREFDCLTPEEIFQEIQELELLPEEIESVLNLKEILKQSAEKYGPSSRNWAVVGNGPNKVAADEIRIKLSELCYKSIPCDFTEDKKHIDLSTEPLTIVVANDLAEQLVQDTAKEVAIFKAHNGRPLVFCARGEKRFHDHAEMFVELPSVGAGLGFVLATVAGHLWGFYAAKAIDSRADELRKVRSLLSQELENPELVNSEMLASRLHSVLNLMAQGEMNAALPASTVAALSVYMSRLGVSSNGREIGRSELEEGINLLNRAIEEMTRPIDTIRHQAKTVTVGISRPQEILPPVLLIALDRLSVPPGEIKEQDRRILRTVSPLISEVQGGLLYRIVRSVDGISPGLSGDAHLIQVTERFGSCTGKESRYDHPRPAGGSKRTVMRIEKSIWSSGRDGVENLVIIPLFDEDKGTPTGILLFHLNFVAQATVQQKLGVLRGLGSRYYDLVERLEEISEPRSIEEILELIPPRDMVLAPLENLVLSRNLSTT